MTQNIVIPEEFKNKLKFTKKENVLIIEASIPSAYNWNDLTLDEELTAKDHKTVKTIMKEYKKGEYLTEEEFFEELKK